MVGKSLFNNVGVGSHPGSWLQSLLNAMTVVYLNHPEVNFGNFSKRNLASRVQNIDLYIVRGW